MIRLLHITIVIGLIALFVLAVLTSNGPGPQVTEQRAYVVDELHL